VIALLATLALLSVDARCAPAIYVVYSADSGQRPRLVVDGTDADEADEVQRYSNRRAARFETNIPAPKTFTVQLRIGDQLSNAIRIHFKPWHIAARKRDIRCDADSGRASP
jgi:hypothetical protein